MKLKIPSGLFHSTLILRTWFSFFDNKNDQYSLKSRLLNELLFQAIGHGHEEFFNDAIIALII
tara:strand:+ start:1433 stop:1621 length:189 start_codon:yes stop_codon:yes gene_type:complete